MTTDDLRARLRRYQDLAEKATPGPWERSDDEEYIVTKASDEAMLAHFPGILGWVGWKNVIGSYFNYDDDPEFVAASRTEGPAFARALQAVLDLCDERDRSFAPSGYTLTTKEVRTAISEALGKEAE